MVPKEFSNGEAFSIGSLSLSNRLRIEKWLQNIEIAFELRGWFCSFIFFQGLIQSIKSLLSYADSKY